MEIVVKEDEARQFFKEHPRIMENTPISNREWKILFGEHLIEGGTMQEIRHCYTEVREPR